MPNVTRRRRAETAGTPAPASLCRAASSAGPGAPIIVAGKPVEIVVASVSPSPCGSPCCPSAGRRRSRTTARWCARRQGQGSAARRTPESFAPIRAGNLTVRFTAEPPAIHVETAAGQPVQQLTLDAPSPTCRFCCRRGRCSGFGEGGPQFDRKGTHRQRMRNGQGGYQLRTHGGRVPIQWLVGTDGWGLFIHQPLGVVRFHGRRRAGSTPGRGSDRAAARRVRHSLEGSRGDHAPSTRGSPAMRNCRRSGRSATCSRTGRSPDRTR